jgi:hypothetical protein
MGETSPDASMRAGTGDEPAAGPGLGELVDDRERDISPPRVRRCHPG